MTAFCWRDFQIWFEGFSENIENAPSGKQWTRIKEQIARVDGGSSAPAPIPSAPVQETAAPDPKPKRRTVAMWQQEFVKHLVDELGYDPESAREMVPPKIDTTIDPASAARTVHTTGGALN